MPSNRIRGREFMKSGICHQLKTGSRSVKSLKEEKNMSTLTPLQSFSYNRHLLNPSTNPVNGTKYFIFYIITLNLAIL